MLVHPEIADGNLMDWAFFRVEVSAPHAKSPAGDKHHSLRRRFHDVRPLATTSPKDPFCHVYYILPGLARTESFRRRTHRVQTVFIVPQREDAALRQLGRR